MYRRTSLYLLLCFEKTEGIVARHESIQERVRRPERIVSVEAKKLFWACIYREDQGGGHRQNRLVVLSV